MGSAAEFKAMCEFLTSKKVVLEGLVDTVFKGLESADEAFEKMKNGSQFGIRLGNSWLICREIGNFSVAG